MCPFRRASALKIREKNLSHIHQSQGGNRVDCCELRLINLSTSRRKSRGLLLTLVPHTPIFQILITRLFRLLTLCQPMKHQQASALCLHRHPLQGKRMGTQLVDCQGHYATPPKKTSHSLHFHNSSINKGVCFPLPLWCVTLRCRFVFNMCDRIHLTGSERKTFFSLEQQQPFNPNTAFTF